VREAVDRAVSWIEPGTQDEYPMPYLAYRRAREAQERMPARHRRDGSSDVEVVLTFRPDVSPRVQRIVSEVLRAIRRGRPAADAIRQVARRFGLRHAHARAFITAGIGFEIRSRLPEAASVAGVASSSCSLSSDWI
jgi:hypothetical protein